MSFSESLLYDTAPPAADTAGGAAALKARRTGAATAMLLPVLRRVASDRIGADTLEDAWRVVERLEAMGLNHTLGFWDTPAYSPAEVVATYQAAIERAASGRTGGYVSIKPPALRFDAGAARALAVSAKRAKVRLHCDSHGLGVADLTFAFADDLLRDLPPELVSVTLPGRWARSLADADRLGAQGVGIRIVKGQWPDPAAPGAELREGFLALVDKVAGHARPVAVASRDAPLLTEAVSRLSASGTASELEFIHGTWSQPLLDIAAKTGAPARIYVPYGKGFVPSALGVLRRNPALAVEVLKDIVGARRT